jgi:DNA repair photolyase
MEAIVPADPCTIQRILDRALLRRRGGIVAQFLQNRTPLHFGGMSDPLQPAELKHKVTLKTLKALVAHQYPTVLSTRSTIASLSPYLEVLQALETAVVQFSFSTTRDEIAARIEPHASKPSDLLKTMEVLSNKGVIVTGRWQPYIPGTSEDPLEFVGRMAGTGCRHLAFEHLKLPVERQHPLWETFSKGATVNPLQIFQQRGAYRDGRELVLPSSEEKLRRVLEVQDTVHRFGMTFGAADNEFQYLSDGDCCRSGVDQFPGFENWYKHQLAVAVKRSNGAEICYGSIEREWTPDGSIDRHLNSHSRLSSRTDQTGSMEQHILARWNASSSGSSPSMFYGVQPGVQGVDGNLIYHWDSDVLMQMAIERHRLLSPGEVE